MFKIGDRVRIIGTKDGAFFGFGSVADLGDPLTVVPQQVLVQFDGFELPIWFPCTALTAADNGIRRAQKCLKENSE